MCKTSLILPRITRFGSCDFAKLSGEAKGRGQTVQICKRLVNRGLFI
jgi:hypothetical protein